MTTGKKNRRIVFCDFDGTITKKETFVAMLNRFAPDKMKEFSRKFAENSVTLREGVRGVLETIPSSEYENVVAFIKDMEIRDGFPEFLVFLKNEGVPFVVISGGLKDSVQTRLEVFSEYISGIFASSIDTGGDYLRVVSDFEHDDELVAKVRVMALYQFEESVAIGDGVTDNKIAMNSSMVFARDRLATFMAKSNKSFIPWNDFHDIRNFLENHWRTTKTSLSA